MPLIFFTIKSYKFLGKEIAGNLYRLLNHFQHLISIRLGFIYES